MIEILQRIWRPVVLFFTVTLGSGHKGWRVFFVVASTLVVGAAAYFVARGLSVPLVHLLSQERRNHKD